MEIRFYDSSLNFIGIMENQTSLLWTRKYNEPGVFELYAPITADNLKLTSLGNLIWIKGNAEAGVIEQRVLTESNTKNRITVKGRFLSSYMDRRIIKGTVNFSGLVETAMRELIITHCAEIPLLEMGDAKGFEDTAEFQATYKGLLEIIQKLAKQANMGFRFRPDFDNKKMVFETYKGVDRTLSQDVNSRVVFTESYNNLNNTNFTESNQLQKTVVYVGGEGEGDARTIVKVGDETGLALREVFVNASDIRKDELTEAEYIAALTTRGEETLNEKAESQSFECDTGADINFQYKVNYDVGDIVTVRKSAWGITQDLRITAIREVYEYGGLTIEPTLGTPLPETIDWSN